ncbi:MAG: hypothetical protein U0670_16390 [Anaerolineae bacterium]
MTNAIYRNLDGSIGQDISDLGNTFALTTLSGGVITFSATLMSVDTEDAVPLDELTTIANGGTGKVLLLRSSNSARRVKLRHGVGNIWCAGGDILLDDPNKLVMLIYNSMKWVVIGYDGTGALLSLPPDACATYFNDFDGGESGPVGASTYLPSGDRPFGVWVNTAGGIGSQTGGRTSPGVLKGTQVTPPAPAGHKIEVTAIIDYGQSAACAIARVRFWYRGDSSYSGTQASAMLRFFSAAGTQVGSTVMFYAGNLIRTWTQAQWTGAVSGVRYVVLTHECAADSGAMTYIDEIEIN